VADEEEQHAIARLDVIEKARRVAGDLEEAFAGRIDFERGGGDGFDARTLHSREVETYVRIGVRTHMT
jgi:hypothetical protein